MVLRLVWIVVGAIAGLIGGVIDGFGVGLAVMSLGPSRTDGSYGMVEMPGYRRATMLPPKMACIVQPSPAFAGTVCPTKTGIRSSTCQCGDLPYMGRRDFKRF